MEAVHAVPLPKAEPQLSGKTLNTLGKVVGHFLTNWKPRRLILMALGAWIYRISLGNWTIGDAMIPLAILALWPVQEWIIHVYILHMKPFKIFGKTFEQHSAKKHREHHENPTSLDNIFIDFPQQMSGALVYLIIWYTIMPTESLTWTGLAVMMTLAVHYEWVHLLVHTSYVPKSAWYRRLRENHRLHHFRNEHYWYGVSMTNGDVVFHTNPKKDEVERSKTCLTLGREEDFINA